MGTIKIVADSSMTIEPELVKALDITVVPLSVMIDSKLYSDNDLKEEGYFLSLMKASKSLPKTSQPPVGLFAETYEKLVKEGATDIVAIHLSPALSGTIEASRQGAEIAEAPVTVLDSGFTDQALKFQVVAAAKLAQAGASLEDILAAVQDIKSKTELYIGVSTLENLVKGRGNKTFTKWLDGYLADNSHRPIAEVAISYAGEADLALMLKEKIAAHYTGLITVLETGSIIQTHTGEGAFAVMVRYE